MNEELLKRVLKYKITAAGKIADQLPPGISKGLRNIGRIIAESINESYQEMKDQPVCKTKSSDKLNNITIE